jgi:hypothetical protein
VGVLVCLPRESRFPVLMRAADWWAKAPLSARVDLIADGNRSFTALRLPRTISCTVYEWSPLRLSLWYKLQSTRPRFFHPILCVIFLCLGAVALFSVHSAPAAQTLSSKRWLTIVIIESIHATKMIAVDPPPPTPNTNSVRRSLGECSKVVRVRLSFAIGERVY